MSKARQQRREAERRERRTGRSPGRSGRSDLGWALGLTVLAWVHRLAFLKSNLDWDWPYTIFYEGDSETFYEYARALLNGRLYDNGIPFHPPGFAWVLAFIHTLVGAGAGHERVPYFAVKVVTALIGSLPVGLLYLLVRPYLGRAVALVAALLCAWSFGLYVIGVAPVTEGTYLTVLFLGLLLWTRRFEHPLSAPDAISAGPSGGWKSALVLGLLLGFLALVRAEAVLIAVILVAVGLLPWIRLRSAAGLRPWAFVILGWILAVAPWAIRNAVHLSEMNDRLAGQLAEPLPRFVPLTIYGPVNLALANNPRADGTFSREFLASKAQSGVLDLKDPQHLEFILHGNRIAFDWIRKNPGDFVRLALRKWTLFFSAWKLGWTQWDWPGGLNGTRLPVDVFTPDSGAGWGLGLPLAVLGLLCGLATPGAPRRWTAIVLLLTLAGMITTGLFFGYVRQGLLYLPFWLTLTAAALVWIGERIAKLTSGFLLTPIDPPRRLLQVLGGIAAVLLVLELSGIGTNRNFEATGTTLPGQQYLDRDQPMFLKVKAR
ncbi:MAG TPA: glycosyltransferase family 39 protein [Thermoanaerobaculia bacterium]|jgi:4-amino-4-deoxy-L-arabinose transferase-like glycosyltransferase|nr:glycosyltransferase family 39 protein [Thermoanaerobaculia bacterium]